MEKAKRYLSIRFKIIAVLFVSVLFLIGIFYYISNTIVFKSYLSLENRKMLTNISRVEKLFKNSFVELGKKSADWATWDDTYSFIQDKNSAYITSNLGENSFVSIDVNAMVYLDNSGQIIFSKILNLDTIQEFSSQELDSYIKNSISDFQFTDLKGQFQGVINLKEGDLVIVAKPILNSNGEGPIRGTLVFGRFINEAFVNNIQNLSQLPVSIYPYESISKDPVLLSASKEIYSDADSYIHFDSDKVISGYFMVYDINNKPTLFFRVSYIREIFGEGNSVFNIFLISMIFSILFFMVIVLIFIEKVFILRFKRLIKQVSVIAESADFTKRIVVVHNDEIGDLVDSINKMLDELDLSTANERISLEAEKAALSKLQENLDQVSKMNKLMVGRELEMFKLKKELADLKNSK